MKWNGLGQIKNVFPVIGMKILGRVGTHIFFLGGGGGDIIP